MRFLLLLPHFAAAGFFSDHVAKSLNHEIDPCDDFYDHVCSTTLVNGSRFQEEANKSFYNTIQQLVSPTIHAFRMKAKEDIERSPDVEMDPEDSKALESYFSKHFKENECRPAELNLIEAYLHAIEAYDALVKLQSSPHYKKLEKKMEPIFEVLKGILNEEFVAAPWTKRHPQLVKFLKTVKLDHDELPSLELENKTITIEERYENCLSISPNKTKKLSIECLNFAACPSMLQGIEVDGKVLTFFYVLFHRVNFALSFNAGYSTESNTVSVAGPVYYLEEDDLPFMLGSLDVVLSHEMGHIFFNGKAVPANSECFRKHIQKTCNTFVSNKTECVQYYDTKPDGTPTENGNYSRLGDDASDWIGMYAGLKSLRKHYPNVFTDGIQRGHLNSTELMKKLFYAHAINWCSKTSEKGDEDHSPNKVRVNGIISLFDEFTEVFQCKRRSKMAKAAKCLPFAGVGAPTHKRPGQR